MNQLRADRFPFSGEWKRAKQRRKIKTGVRQAEEESLHAQMIGVQGSGSGAWEPGSGPQCWRSLWAHWWWGCTDGLKPGSRLTPLYGLCSLITADECVYVCVRESEWGREEGRGELGWRTWGGGNTQAGDRTRRGTCGRSSAPSGTTYPQPDS